MASSIDAHPQRTEIIEAIAAGRSYRDIAASVSPRVSLMTLQRYAKRDTVTTTPTIRRANTTASVDKQWAEERLVKIVDRAMLTGKVEHLNIARAALRDLYEANGWMAPKRTESLVANLHALAPAQLRTVLAQVCSSLPAAMQHELAAAAPDVIDVPALPAPDPLP